MSDYLTDYESRSRLKVELDLKNYATKEEFKNITHLDTSSFALKTNLSSLRTEVDKLDIPRLTTVPTDLSKLTKEFQEDVTRKTDFNLLKTKVDKNETDNDIWKLRSIIITQQQKQVLKTKADSIDVSKYLLKSDYDTKIGNLKLKISDVSGLLQTSSFNRKVNELETKIRSAESKPDITNLATKSTLTAVEHKIPDVKGFFKLSDYSSEVTSIKNDYVSNAALTNN